MKNGEKAKYYQTICADLFQDIKMSIINTKLCSPQMHNIALDI